MRAKFRVPTVIGLNCVLYFIILSAYLNAVLRLSAGSNITLFRVLIPVAVLLILLSSAELFLKFVLAAVILGVIQLCQHMMTGSVFYPIVGYSLRIFLEYYFHYCCILLLFFCILALRKLEGEKFDRRFVLFLTGFVKCMAVFILVYTVVLGRALSTISRADNINNIGCMMAAGMSLLLVEARKDRKQLLWCLLIVFLLYHNDSKAALLGALAEIMIYIMIRFSNAPRSGRAILRCLIAVVAVLMAALVFLLIPKTEGYSLWGLIANPVGRVLRNDPFPYANTSISYRTNSTITALNILKTSFGLGVGIGNTGRVLREVMVNVYETWSSSLTYSLHNWWLELMCDFGWPAILAELVLFVSAFRRLLFKRIESAADYLQCVFFLSFPIWSISASGLTTEFYSLSVLIFALLITGSTSGKRLVFIKSIETH